MQQRRTLAALASVVVWLAAPAAAQWRAVRLHNPAAFSSSYATAAAGGVQGGQAEINGRDWPVLWHASANQWVNLAAGSSQGGAILAMDAQFQVGWYGPLHAAMWSGTPGSRVDLHPAGYEGSYAHGVGDGEQVGYVFGGIAGATNQAALWRGSAQSFVNLHPAGATHSEAHAVVGGQQGGLAWFPQPGGGLPVQHAALWSGSAASFVDLNPPGVLASSIGGMVPGQQVGGYYMPGFAFGHAALWTGTPESMIDLNPPGALGSGANATCGSAQVGVANLPVTHWSAVIWFGSATDYINLHALLPAGQYVQSTARAVSIHDGHYYVSGYALGPNGNEAWLWIGPVPAPGPGAVLLAAGLGALRRRRT